MIFGPIPKASMPNASTPNHTWHGTINLDSLLFLLKLNSPKSHKPVGKTASEEPVVTRGHRPSSAFQRAYSSGTLRGCLPPSARVRSTTLVLFKIKITIAMGLKKGWDHCSHKRRWSYHWELWQGGAALEWLSRAYLHQGGITFQFHHGYVSLIFFFFPTCYNVKEEMVWWQFFSFFF